MLVDRHIHATWKILQKHRDIAAISKETGIKRVKISDAINKAWADDNTFRAVNNFYESRRTASEKNLPY